MLHIHRPILVCCQSQGARCVCPCETAGDFTQPRPALPCVGFPGRRIACARAQTKPAARPQLSYKTLFGLRNLERANGFEPSTLTLARLCSTPELRPHSKFEVGGYRP